MFIPGVVLGALAQARLVASDAFAALAPTTLTLRWEAAARADADPPIVLLHLPKGADARKVLATLPPLGPGRYHLAWRAGGGEDSTVRGELRFTVR